MSIGPDVLTRGVDVDAKDAELQMTLPQREDDRSPFAAKKTVVELENALSVLTAQQVSIIDRTLAEIGDFGEVHLVKRKGVLRYVIRVESRDIGSAY